MPVGAAIVGAKHAAGHHREHALPMRSACHREADASHAGLGESMAGERRPGLSLVGGFVDARARLRQVRPVRRRPLRRRHHRRRGRRAA